MPQNLQNTNTFFSFTVSANVGSSASLSTILTNTINSNIYLASYEVRSIRMVNWSASATNVSLYINQYSTNVLYLVGKRFVPAGGTVNFADRYESFVMHDNDVLLGNTDILGTNVTVTVNIDEYTETDPKFIPLTTGSVAGAPIAYDILMIGGGGGGGQTFCSRSNQGGGGGGAGGVLYTTVAGTVSTGTTYPVVIGAGGAEAISGSNTCFLSFTALGGGRGGYNNLAQSGGSGGGGTGSSPAGNGLQAPASCGSASPVAPKSPYETYRGLGSGASSSLSLTGAGTNGNYYGATWASGGGGGGQQAGLGGGQYSGGPGGAGILLSNFTYWGTDASNQTAPASGKGYFAGGGQGGGWWGSGGGAVGGGGRGGYGRDVVQGQPGVQGTGGGAGGGGGGTANDNGNSGGTGGSGLLIIRYPGSTASATGGNITICGGYVYHVFCSAGSFTFTN